MSVWAWIGEGSLLVGFLSRCLCWTVVARSHQDHWLSAARGRRVQVFSLGGAIAVSALFLFNLWLQSLQDARLGGG